MNIQNILVKPVLTERTLGAISNANEYTFLVHRQATKPEIKKACEALFGVSVVSVHTVVMKGGQRRIMGRKMVITTDTNWKKAVVKLKNGDTIDLFDFGVDKKEKKEEKKKAEKKDDNTKAMKSSKKETEEAAPAEKKSGLRARLRGKKEEVAE